METKHLLLIVDDNLLKQEEIRKALPTLPNFEVSSVSSIAQAYRLVIAKPPTLMILDMTFQVSQGAGRDIAKQALAGVELLQYISRRRLRTKVIVATQHSVFSSPELRSNLSLEQLDLQLRRSFPLNFRCIVKVDLGDSKWKHTLNSEISEAVNELGA